jgi:hypothetical protein
LLTSLPDLEREVEARTLVVVFWLTVLLVSFCLFEPRSRRQS